MSKQFEDAWSLLETGRAAVGQVLDHLAQHPAGITKTQADHLWHLSADIQRKAIQLHGIINSMAHPMAMRKDT